MAAEAKQGAAPVIGRQAAREFGVSVLNALTVDLEDWAQAVLDPRLPVTDRVVGNVRRVLDCLDDWGVKATFFALGKVCERFPRLLPAVVARGHEVASHGYGHELVYRLTRDSFTADVQRSSAIIESQIGRRPMGYRAPAFSITRQSLWAGPILDRLGFRYSSSIFPIHARRYGLPETPRGPHRWPNCDLIEFPLPTVRLGGRCWPACGGGYTRLLPAPLLARAIRSLNARGWPAVVYLHPYELAVGEVDWFRRAGTVVTWRKRLTQSLWRSRVAKRIGRLTAEFAFGPLGEVAARYERSPVSGAGPAFDAGDSPMAAALPA